MDDLLGMGNSQQVQSTGFGFEADQQENGEDDWAKMDVFGTSSPAVPNDFAKGQLIEVLNQSAKG